MEVVPSDRKPKHHQDFNSLAVTDLSPSTSSPTFPPVVTASFAADNSGVSQLRLRRPESGGEAICFGLRTSQLFNLGPLETLVVVEESGNSEAAKESSSFSKAFKIEFATLYQQRAFCAAFEQWKHGVSVTQNGPLENGSITSPKSKFDNKIEASSAKMYFHYYGQLLHQQNMLQDYVRTGTYYSAVIENCIDFQGRVVVDVGAGSGILSLFAAQAGAKHVYAVEASEMAEYATRLIAGNESLRHLITVIKGKIEDVELPEKADILISEPMGTLLVNERMLETYVIARDRFLVPNGKMFPSIGRIHMAPFSDEYLFVEIANKALFWQQRNFYGVDLTPLYGSAFQGYFSQPVVDAFDPRILVSPPSSHSLDFNSIKEEDLYEIDIPLSFIAAVGTRVHGLACWFDVLFNGRCSYAMPYSVANMKLLSPGSSLLQKSKVVKLKSCELCGLIGSSVQRWLTTAPGSPTTHWYQMRCVLSQPLYVMAGQEITGRLHLVAHSAQSYTINLTLSAKMWGPGADQGGIIQTSTGKLELKEPYYRLSQPQPYMPPAQDQLLHQHYITPQDGNATSINTQQPQSSGFFMNQ